MDGSDDTFFSSSWNADSPLRAQQSGGVQQQQQQSSQQLQQQQQQQQQQQPLSLGTDPSLLDITDELDSDDFFQDLLDLELPARGGLGLQNDASQPSQAPSTPSQRFVATSSPQQINPVEPSSVSTTTSSAAPMDERATKRRRLNNGGPATRPGETRQTSIDLTDDGAGFVPLSPGQRESSIRLANAAQRRNFASYWGTVTTNQGPTSQSGPGSTTARGPPGTDGPSPTHRLAAINSSAAAGDGATQTGGEGAVSQPEASLSAGPLPQVRDAGSGMGDLEAIDLTAVTDDASLRRREQLDEEERRARREASMRLEARKQANQRMLQSTLQQQEAEAKKDDSSQKGIGNMQCVICMDSFTDLTATHCGHLFCHTCINEHLITAEMSHVNRSALCPFCRQTIYRKPTRQRDNNKTIVPLSFKVRKRHPANYAEKGKKREIEQPD